MNDNIKVADGIMQAELNQQFAESARAFMDDNGFAYNDQGRALACHHVQEWAEREHIDIEMVTAIQTAILTIQEN